MNETLKRLQKKYRKKTGPLDNLDWVCRRFMLQIRNEARGHKYEIKPGDIVRRAKVFGNAYKISANTLVDGLIRRGWLEPSAGDAYIIRWDLVER